MSDQFDKSNELFKKLDKNYNIRISYFQTGVMIYHTQIIKENTFEKLYNLAIEYPISKYNEQGIIALYFTNIENLWVQIQKENDELYFYDFLKRHNDKEYIMIKYLDVNDHFKY